MVAYLSCTQLAQLVAAARLLNRMFSSRSTGPSSLYTNTPLCSPVRKSVSVQSVKVTMSSFTSQCARARDSGAGPRIFLLQAGTAGWQGGL